MLDLGIYQAQPGRSVPGSPEDCSAECNHGGRLRERRSLGSLTRHNPEVPPVILAEL